MQKTILIKIRAWNEELQSFQEEVINPDYIQRIKPLGNGSNSEYTAIYLEGRTEIVKIEHDFGRFLHILEASKIIIS